MSKNNSSENFSENDISLVDQVDDYVSTDIITDLKTGVYNLFLSLLNHLTAVHGPVKAVEISTEFLDNISNTFKETINITENEK